MLTSVHKLRGFTLIELMVAVAIFALLMGLGIPAFQSWIQNQQTRNGAEAILNGLQVARSEAVKRNSNTIFVLCDVAAGGTGSTWDVLSISATAVDSACISPTPTGAALTGWERVQFRPGQEGAQNAAVSSAANANTIAFGGMGRTTTVPTIGAGALPPSAQPLVQGLNLVNVHNPQGNKPAGLSVTISAAGSLRMCDPGATIAVGDPRRC